MDPRQTAYDNAARAELRRLVSNAQPPSDTPSSAFGPWAEYVDPLRAAHPRGTEALRRAFVALANMEPAIGRLLSSEPEPRRTGWNLDDLLLARLPEPEWVIPDVLPVGLATLAGRPKVGKSWLALQIALAVGKGGRVLDRDVAQRQVLYLALEDSPRRMQDRALAQGATLPTNVRIELEWPPLAPTGLDRLQVAIAQGGYGLVIVDTLSRALGSADQLDLAEMSVILGELQDLTRWTGATILTIDHHKKPSGFGYTDPVDDILGSTGKAAIVDVAMGLYVERGKHEATFKVVGRDVLGIELAVAWDGQLHCWHVMGEAGEVRKEGTRAAILAAIKELGQMGQLTNTATIAQHLSKDRGQVSRGLAALLEMGKIVKGEKAGAVVPYHLAPGPEAPPADQDQHSQ